MSFTAQDVKALRESPGAGMMDCKKALEESSGDIEAAKQYLREKGLAASAKLSLTVASETGQPPTAALTAILLAVRSAQQPPLSYALHPLRIH